MSNISVDYDILNQKQTPAFYASSLATRPAFGFPGRIFIDTDTPSSGIYRDTGSAWVQVADPGAGTTGTLQQVTTNGNTTTLGVTIQGLTIGKGAGTIASNTAIGNLALNSNTTGSGITAIGSSALQSNTTGQNNIGVGANSLFANTTGGNNTGLGANTLIANTTASFNTAIGSLAMSLNSTGSNNTAVGYNSLLNNTTGTDNIAIGVSALQLNTTTSFNIAIGNNSLRDNTTGIYNIGLGSSALEKNTTGNYNTAIGRTTLQSNTTASNNTGIGAGVMQLNTTGANNTAVGFASLSLNTTGASNTAVGTSALQSNTTASNNIAVGYASLYANTTGNQNTAIGTNSLFANTTGSTNTAIGFSTLIANTTGANNIAIGSSSLITNTTGSNNVAIGTGSSYFNTTGSNNTAVGNSSLQQNTTGTNNVAIGSSALISNTTGQNNSSLGTSSLFANTTGDSNTAIGSASLQTNISGSNNTAIGYAALNLNTGAQNTAIGNTALQNNSTGASNVAIGHITLLANTTGGANTGIGRGALTANTTGTFNVGIGYGAGGLITTGGKNSILGSYPGTATMSNYIVLSDGDANVRLFSNDTGKVGINVPITDTPTGQVDIHTSLTNALVLNGNTTNNAYLGFASAGVNKWRIGNTYNAGANTFDIYNLGTSSNALSFNATTNNASFFGNIASVPTGTTNAFLTASGSTGSYSGVLSLQRGGTEDGVLYTASTNYTPVTGVSNADIVLYAAGGGRSLRFATASTSANMSLTSGGKVLIGTTTESTGISLNDILTIGASTASNAVKFTNGGSTNWGYIVTEATKIVLGTDNRIDFEAGATKRMSILSGGQVNINNSTANSQIKLAILQTQNNHVSSFYVNNGSNNGCIYAQVDDIQNVFAYFNYNGTLVGSISTNGTLTAYNVSSDYRLKQDFKNYNGLDLISAIKTYDYEWKSDKSRMYGVIAHELQEILPYAVTGKKDAEQMQGVDYSKIVPILIKSIQELKAEIDALKNN